MTSDDLGGSSTDAAAGHEPDEVVKIRLGFDCEVGVRLVCQVEGFVCSDSVVTYLLARTLHHWHCLEGFKTRSSAAKLLGQTVAITFKHDKRIASPQGLEAVGTCGDLRGL